MRLRPLHRSPGLAMAAMEMGGQIHPSFCWDEDEVAEAWTGAGVS